MTSPKMKAPTALAGGGALEVVCSAARDIEENTAQPQALQAAFLRRRGISAALAATIASHAFAVGPTWRAVTR